MFHTSELAEGRRELLVARLLFTTGQITRVNQYGMKTIGFIVIRVTLVIFESGDIGKVV